MRKAIINIKAEIDIDGRKADIAEILEGKELQDATPYELAEIVADLSENTEATMKIVES